MKIYISHATSFDFKNELYVPLRNSDLNKEHEIILPHEQSDKLFPTKEMLKHFDLVLAEVSFPSTGVGIELGWANEKGVPIICIYKKGIKVSSSLKAVTDQFIEYDSVKDLIASLTSSLTPRGS